MQMLGCTFARPRRMGSGDRVGVYPREWRDVRFDAQLPIIMGHGGGESEAYFASQSDTQDPGLRVKSAIL